MWIISALAAGLLFTVSNLLTRHILKANKDAWAFSFYYSLGGFLVSLPFMLSEPRMTASPTLWLIMLLVGILIVLQNYLSFKSSETITASVSGTVSKFRLVWVFLLGLLLAHETYSNNKLLGLVLTVTAGMLFVFKKGQVINKKGLLYAFCSTFFYAIVIGLYGNLLLDFNSQTLTAFIFLVPAVLNFALMPNRVVRIRNMWIVNKWILLITCVAGGLANLAMNYSLSLGSPTSTLVVIEASLILILIGESLILKEREALLRKSIAAILAVLGAIVIRLG